MIARLNSLLDGRPASFTYELAKVKRQISDDDVKSLAVNAVKHEDAEAFNILAAHFPAVVSPELFESCRPGNTFVYRLGALQRDGSLAPSLRNFTVIPAEKPDLFNSYLATRRSAGMFPHFFALQKDGMHDGTSFIGKIDETGKVCEVSGKKPT